MALNARKHTIPAGTDTTVSRDTIFEDFGNSIRDVVPVASVTERTQLVTALTTAGQAPSATKPLVVLRADAPGLHRLEYTTNGTVWLSSSGTLQFASVSARDSWTTSNSGLLTVGDEAVAGGVEAEWNGTAWVGSGWTAAPSLSSGWTATAEPIQYRVKGGVLYWSGRLNATSTAPNQVFGSPLPVGARVDLDAPVTISETNSALNRVPASILANGHLVVFKSTGTPVELSLATLPPRPVA